MTKNTPLMTFQRDAEVLAALVQISLEEKNWRTRRGMDLHAACASFTQVSCPHKPSQPCDCRVIVLTAIKPGREAVTSLIFHEHDGRTEVFVESERPLSPELEACLREN